MFKFDFKAFWDAKSNGKRNDWSNVGFDYSLPGIHAFVFVVVLDWPPHCPISFQCQCYGDVNRRGQNKGMQWVQKVAKDVFMELVKLKVPFKAVGQFSLCFKNLTDDKDVVEDGQEDEQAVEDTIHAVATQNGNGNSVRYDSHYSNYTLYHVLHHHHVLVCNICSQLSLG